MVIPARYVLMAFISETLLAVVYGIAFYLSVWLDQEPLAIGLQ